MIANPAAQWSNPVAHAGVVTAAERDGAMGFAAADAVVFDADWARSSDGPAVARGAGQTWPANRSSTPVAVPTTRVPGPWYG